MDEEHKFGVAQRAGIVAKTDRGIHKGSMSATPIPRSLAQVIYGDVRQSERSELERSCEPLQADTTSV